MFRYITQHISFLFCFILLLVSGNPIFVYSPYVREMYGALALFLLLYAVVKRYTILLTFVKYSSLFVIIFLLQQISIFNLSLNSQLFVLARIYIGVAIFIMLDDKFVMEYVKVMVVLAGLSLLFYLYNVFYGLIPGIQTSDIGYSLIIYTQLYTDYSGLVFRNSGMFWEPGAYQGYLNLAIAFLLLIQDFKNKKLCLLILSCALLTTFSTTGYIAYGFILIFYVLYFANLSRLRRSFLFIGLLGLCVFAFYRISFLYDKILNNFQDIDSAQGRISDYIRFGTLIKKHLFLGINTEEYDISTGNSIVFMLLYFGGVIMLYYFVILFHNIKKQHSIKVALYILGLVFISLQGEGFIFYPLYLALPVVVIYIGNYEKHETLVTF